MAMLNIPLEKRDVVLNIIDSLENNEGKNLIIALSGGNVDRMAVYKILNNLNKADRDILQPIIDKINTEKMHDNIMNQNISNSDVTYQGFSMQKSGVWLNILIILLGTIFLVFAYKFLLSMGIGIGLSTSMVGIIAIAFFFSLLHYLPTFIYHASLGGKILMFIANSLISVFLIATPIAWLILLVIANSQNKKERYKQEVSHLLKNMNQNKR
ncbi:hypothetical protein G314FT_10390 [Vagococcus luciliae]|uniref:DUF1700 domain-containing protein n=2 Tax=Vagococcus luciliae TaxID=2920380 RepID=A0ABY5NYZ8_9ENTE|nr:hypothetical protein G314FT_10390 [Vagococcus luciliae]